MSKQFFQKDINENDAKMNADAIFPFAFGNNDIDVNYLVERFNKLDKKTSDLFEKIDGPYLHGVSKENIFKDMSIANNLGIGHLKIKQYVEEYGTSGDCSNIIVPIIIDTPNIELDSGSMLIGPGNKESMIGEMIILSNPDDCFAIAKRHIRKQPNFTPILMDSIISTTDNDNWREQRDHFTQAFLPSSSLSKIFPITCDRAKKCAKELRCMLRNQNTQYIDINEFLLHEANAQLNLTMFGNNEFYSEENNKIIRSALKGNESCGVLSNYLDDLIQDFKNNEDKLNNPSSIGVDDNAVIAGPLGKAIATQNVSDLTMWGNGLIFSFAGHDTTGNTMAFFCLELAKHPEYQIRIQKEIDEFFKTHDNLEYQDLEHFPFLTRCWTETLRLWPAVPNGTFRQLQYDDYIVGANGEDICVPKGTYVQISNWCRHRSKDLWGDDAEKFNPDREFVENELWNNNIFMGYNPHSERFSPFSYPPRDCIGKNFAHMEGRAILIYLFKDFNFSIDEYNYELSSPNHYGINKGTMTGSNPLKKVIKNGITINDTGFELKVTLRHMSKL